MYNSQYYTCEQIDERLLQGYLDDYNTQTGQSLTKAQFLTKLGSLFSKEGVIDNTATQIGYYECDTAAGTAAKAITVDNYALFAGGSMKVKFANKNTANNATLNINSQGAKALYYQGERASATNSWDAEEVVEIYYDGTSYYANNVKGGSGSGVYDVSKEHPTSGPNSDGKFTLEYILNSSNVNELIPVNKRYPGMTIQFVSTSDNKYVQFICKTKEFSENPNDWAIYTDGINCPDVSESNGFSIEDDEGMSILVIGNDSFKIANHLIISLQKPEEGQILKYTNGVWVPSNNISSINDIVDMSMVNIGDVLKWNGSEWIGATTIETESADNFSIEDDNGYPAIEISSKKIQLGRFVFNINGLNQEHCLVYNGSEFVNGNPDWVGKSIATYGDSVVAINNGDFDAPFLNQNDMAWGNRAAAYFGMAKQYGRGIGGQMYRWGNGGGSVAFINSDGTLNSRNDNYNYDNYSGEVPAGCTAVRGCLCSWLRITTMFPAAIKDSINAVVLLSHNDARTDELLTTDCQFVPNDTTDTEWAASGADYYGKIGGDYNIGYTKGGIASTIMKLQLWMPQAIIIICTPISGRGETGELNVELTDEGMQTLREVVVDMGDLMSIPCIDLYSNCGINGLNRTRYISDGIHPYLAEGKNMVARAFIAGMKNVLPNF